MVIVVGVLRDINDKDKEAGALMPALQLALSAREVNLPLKLHSLKTVGQHTRGGDGSTPRLCIQTHAAPHRRENQATLTSSPFLLLQRLHEGKEHNTRLLSCFCVSLKIHGNIPPFKNNLLGGRWDSGHTHYQSISKPL